MNQINDHIKLVEGVFSPSDSAEVLLSLLADKIKFHNLQKLLINDEHDPRVLQAERRVRELKEARKSIIQSILKARDAGYSLKIDATIQIEFLRGHE